MHSDIQFDLQTFIENSDEMVGIFDTDFRLVSYNQKFADQFFKSDNIRVKKGLDFLQLINSQNKLIWQERFVSALKGETVKYEFKYKGSNGQCYYMENNYKPVIKNDEVEYVIQTLRIITLRKKFEERIQRNERGLRKLASNIPNSELFLLDVNFNISIASGTEFKRKGFDTDDFIGKNMYDICEQIGLTELWPQFDMARAGNDSQVEFHFMNDFYLIDILPLRDEMNVITGFIIYQRRITHQKENEKKLEDINRSKDNILGIVAHDLRNPISAILGLSDLIKNDSAHPDKYIDLINKSCRTALNIITDLLDISELDNPYYVLKTEPVELVSFLNDLIQSNSTLTESKEIVIGFSSNSSEIRLELNQGKFARVVNNLLVNAIKFSHRRGKIEISTEVHPDRSSVLMKIEDHGVGIPDALKGIIFDKFTKAGRKGTEGEKSLGLGLSIVKRIVELHNGRIWLESKENIGTTVFIEMPLSKEKITQTLDV